MTKARLLLAASAALLALASTAGAEQAFWGGLLGLLMNSVWLI